MSEVSIAKFIDLVKDKLGIIVHSHQLDILNKIIQQSCKKYKYDVNKYYEVLRSSNENSEILEDLITGITIGETYFFRDKKQMDILSGKVLPRIIDQKIKANDFTIRIWSAGCSSGEEIYTVAIMLNELINDIGKWNIDLLGTDINTNLLKKALHGRFGEWSMRSIHDTIKNKYFTKQNKEYHISQKIKNMVTFSYLNLKSDMYPSILNNTNSQDLIICRNVIIYFDKETAKTMLEKFSICLIEGGYLLLGASDPVESLSHHLLVDPDYRLLFFKHIHIDQPVKTMEPMNRKDVSKLYTAHKKEWEKILLEIEKYEEVNVLEPDLLYEKGLSLANLGKLDEAAELFNQCIAKDKLNKAAYLSLAMVLIETGKTSDAESKLRQLLFLDHQDVLAHFQLGLLLLKMGKKKEGMLSLRNALAISKNKNDNELIKGADELSYGRLVEILEKDITVYMG